MLKYIFKKNILNKRIQKYSSKFINEHYNIYNLIASFLNKITKKYICYLKK